MKCSSTNSNRLQRNTLGRQSGETRCGEWTQVTQAQDRLHRNYIDTNHFIRSNNQKTSTKACISANALRATHHRIGRHPGVTQPARTPNK
jgi:hypothetical protein